MATVRQGGLVAFPAIALVVILYNALAFLGPMFMGETESAQPVRDLLARGFDITLMSGDIWTLSISDILIMLGLATLFLEVIRATQTSGTSIINHSLSMALFVVCLVEFIMLQGFGTSTFFIIMLMTIFDVTAGFTITIVASRRDIGVGGAGAGFVPLNGDN